MGKKDARWEILEDTLEWCEEIISSFKIGSGNDPPCGITTKKHKIANGANYNKS
jgi:hypothetical protein